MKDSSLSPAGLLQPLPIPELVFEDISMDFITGLPAAKGKTVIVVVVDRLSKYGHFSALRGNCTSESVAAVFVTDIIRLHGIPGSIVTDRDPKFLHNFWQEVHRLQGTELPTSTAYHPQTNGQTEALSKCLEMYLRCFVADTPNQWIAVLPWAEYWYNTSFQTSAGMTPFEILYGRSPPTIPRYIKGSTAQGRMKSLADKHRREVHFQVGDWVYVKLKPYRQNSVRLQRHHKLGRSFFGPYKVIKRVGEVAYKLELPESARIHSVFHVSMLRKCVGTPEQQVTPLHLVDHDSSLLLQPAKLLAHRVVKRSDQLVEQLLVRWEGLPTDAAIWEDKLQLEQRFPTLNLEDKVLKTEGGNVMNIPEATSTVEDDVERADSERANWEIQRLRRSSRIRQCSKKFDGYVVGSISVRR
ncbi:hypothetical protein H6P81_016280 [Aristolochia fimbriata]|uniref:Integrase catalytic domain-containing protein n=1 Tax=Aristolochia fimbriata TaxID=158543 RepID=A0AAV7E9Y0_ARIFI|nr:hypothetical protein H6P81_016280 [Aristolochia fimbriata]